ncbi:hypothetical protein MRX96_057867 [Rhipicephalus microplus]
MVMQPPRLGNNIAMTSTSTRNSATMASRSTTDVTPTVSSDDGKLPPLWTVDPALWLIQVEAQFAARRIATDLTKYHYVISSLPPPITSKLRDLLLHPPAKKACVTLNKTLVHRVTPPESQRLHQLFHVTNLGDCTHSQLLRRMQLLRGERMNSVDRKLFRELFLQKRPSSVRLVAEASEQKYLPAFAELAD